MDKKLWYRNGAEVWEEALPIGNGRIGAMVFGGALNEKIQINEDTLWTGYPNKEKRKHNMTEVHKFRQLISEGKYAEAEKAVSESMLNIRCEAYQTYGNIYIDSITNASAQITDYRRELDMSCGISRTSFCINGAEAVRESFVSLADDVLVIHLKSENPQKYSIYQAVNLKNSIEVSENITKVMGKCPVNTKLEYTDEESVHFCSMLAVNNSNAEIVCGYNSLNLQYTREATIIFSIKTSFNGYDKMPVSEGKEYEEACRSILEKACSLSYEELRERHIKEYRKYFDRVELRLDGEDYSDIPTDERIKKAGEGTVDNGLVTLLFDYGRYLAICGSQENTQPMNLQGIWNESQIPPWNSNYTMNINTQMNYWAVETCDLPECHMPFLKMIKEFSQKGNNFGLRGWSSWHNSDIWRFNHEATNCVLWGYWQMGGFWSVRHIWEHYIHTRDAEFLKEYYPVMVGAAEFLEDWMYENDEGYLTVCPSTSPENQFLINGEKCSVCEGCAMDMSIIYDVFDKTVKAGKILKTDTSDFENILLRLKPIKIGKDERILEWGMELEENEKGHRHISHLYGFFPSDIWADGKYDKNVLKTLEFRLENGGGHTGWSNAWIANVHARLKDGEKVMHHIRNMFKKSIYPNMLDAHPPFQIDGNFGICSAVCEALMQSHTGKTELIPALPAEWKSGAVKGFVSRTGEKISFEWKNGKIVNN